MRPLNDVEMGRAVRERDEKYWKNKGIVDTVDCYWLRDPSEAAAG
jgi:hypothetical protein